MDENRIYITVQGDMWDSIAYEFYGNVNYIGLLLQSNPNLMEIFVFSAGVSVYIPELPEEAEGDVPEWRV